MNVFHMFVPHPLRPAFSATYDGVFWLPHHCIGGLIHGVQKLKLKLVWPVPGTSMVLQYCGMPERPTPVGAPEMVGHEFATATNATKAAMAAKRSIGVLSEIREEQRSTMVSKGQNTVSVVITYRTVTGRDVTIKLCRSTLHSYLRINMVTSGT